ncbi:MAG: hypothetical protein VYD68_09755, partial [Pseudomonadota bacterium]|nr:hypothetical protein [Pseudomonadota bacterium]
MLALRQDLIRAGPNIASGGRCSKLDVELDAPGAVAQPERLVAIELISGKPAHMVADAVRTVDGMPAYKFAPGGRPANNLSLGL